MSNVCGLLDQMPLLPDEVPAWFFSLKDSDFDKVCVSAITSIIADEHIETGLVSVTSIARLTQAMRERYRNICGMEAIVGTQPESSERVVGERCYNAKLNETQVRIARRVDKSVSNAAIAKLFDVSESTLRHARNSATWQHVKQGQPSPRRPRASHAA